MFLVFRYRGHISAALVLGGYDVTGPSLYTIAPHGSTDKLPYVTMGNIFFEMNLVSHPAFGNHSMEQDS